MRLRTVAIGYLGATLAVAGTAGSAYKLLQARHASTEAPLSEPRSRPPAVITGPLAETSSRLPPRPELRLPFLSGAAAANPRLPRLRAPLRVALHEVLHRPVRRVVRTAAPYRLHPRIVPYQVYYRVYYPYSYYLYYPAYPY